MPNWNVLKQRLFVIFFFFFFFFRRERLKRKAEDSVKLKILAALKKRCVL